LVEPTLGVRIAQVRNKDTTAIRIGTSGWTYEGWRGPFYPTDVAKKGWLNWYAAQFPAAEVNFSFYRTPSLEAVTAWRKATPPDFVFAWKASKFITHWKRLDPETWQNSIDLMVPAWAAKGEGRPGSFSAATTF
jgi:uncharacterized protein YecE (DUF72 family)